FIFSSSTRHTISDRDWSSDVCSSDLDGSRHFPFGSQSYAGRPLREFCPAIQPHASLSQKLRRKAHVFSTVHTPEPELLLLPLQEIGRASCRELKFLQLRGYNLTLKLS